MEICSLRSTAKRHQCITSFAKNLQQHDLQYSNQIFSEKIKEEIDYLLEVFVKVFTNSYQNLTQTQIHTLNYSHILQ